MERSRRGIILKWTMKYIMTRLAGLNLLRKVFVTENTVIKLRVSEKRFHQLSNCQGFKERRVP